MSVSPNSAAKCLELLSRKRIGGHYEDAYVVVIGHVHNPQISAAVCLSDSDACSTAAWAVLAGMPHHELDPVFIHCMIIDVRQTGVCIDEVAKIHRGRACDHEPSKE
jgi:hypothetical protein